MFGLSFVCSIKYLAYVLKIFYHINNIIVTINDPKKSNSIKEKLRSH